MQEDLKKLLEDWEEYKNIESNIPSRISNREKLSISIAVKLTVEKMDTQEYKKLSLERKKKIEEILGFLEESASAI